MKIYVFWKCFIDYLDPIFGENGANKIDFFRYEIDEWICVTI